MPPDASTTYPHASSRASLGVFLSSWVEQQLLSLPPQGLTRNPPWSCTSSSSSHCSALHLVISKPSKSKKFLHSRPLILVYLWAVRTGKAARSPRWKGPTHKCVCIKAPLQFLPGTQKMNPSRPAARPRRYLWVWEYIHVKLQNKIVFHVNKHVLLASWMLLWQLNTWKHGKTQVQTGNGANSSARNSLWRLELRLETHICQQLWKKGFYLAHFSGSALDKDSTEQTQERSYA